MARGFARRRVLGAALSGLALLACSSSSSTARAPAADAAATLEDAAAIGDAAATTEDGGGGHTGASAYVSLGPIGASSDAGPCPASWLDVGTYGFPVTDGARDSSNGSLVRVDCSVIATGDAGNEFRLEATLRSMSDGGTTTLTITGPISSGTNPQGISVTIARGDGTYSDGNCGAIFSQAGEGVAPGFFSGLLVCSGLKDAAQNRTCNANGQIELQNCSAS